EEADVLAERNRDCTFTHAANVVVTVLTAIARLRHDIGENEAGLLAEDFLGDLRAAFHPPNCRHPGQLGSIRRKLLYRKTLDERPVRRQDVPAYQVGCSDPCEVGNLDGPRRAIDDPARIDQHHEIERRIRVEQHIPDPADRDRDAELFPELAHQGGDRRLAGLDLAAGKLPLQRKRLIRAALRDQNSPVVPEDQPRDHELAGPWFGHQSPLRSTNGAVHGGPSAWRYASVSPS